MNKIVLAGQILRAGEVYQYIYPRGESEMVAGPGRIDVTFTQADRRQATSQRRARGDGNYLLAQALRGHRCKGRSLKPVTADGMQWGRRANDKEAHIDRRTASKQRRARGWGKPTLGRRGLTQSEGGRRGGDKEAHVYVSRLGVALKLGGMRKTDPKNRRAHSGYWYGNSTDPRIVALERRKA